MNNFRRETRYLAIFFIPMPSNLDAIVMPQAVGVDVKDTTTNFKEAGGLASTTAFCMNPVVVGSRKLFF